MNKERKTTSAICVFIVGAKGMGNYGGYETFVVLTRMETLSRNLFKPFKIKELQFS